MFCKRRAKFDSGQKAVTAEKRAKERPKLITYDDSEVMMIGRQVATGIGWRSRSGATLAPVSETKLDVIDLIDRHPVVGF
jgi:hypothetical protein